MLFGRKNSLAFRFFLFRQHVLNVCLREQEIPVTEQIDRNRSGKTSENHWHHAKKQESDCGNVSGLPWEESNPHHKRNGQPMDNVKSEINRYSVCLILITDGAEFPQDICCISVFNTTHSIRTEGPDSVNVLNDLSYGFRCNGILLLAVLFHNSKRQQHFRNEE